MVPGHGEVLYEVLPRISINTNSRLLITYCHEDPRITQNRLSGESQSTDVLAIPQGHIVGVLLRRGTIMVERTISGSSGGVTVLGSCLTG